jgi:hypothetical protein
MEVGAEKGGPVAVGERRPVFNGSTAKCCDSYAREEPSAREAGRARRRVRRTLHIASTVLLE